MMNYSERLKCKQALVSLLVEAKAEFHIVAELPPGVPGSALLPALRGWAARVDRHYLGRNWWKCCPTTERLRGAIFLEIGKNAGLPHAHLIVCIPTGASELHFSLTAQFWFAPHPTPELRKFYPNSVTTRGKMHLTRIKDSEADLKRVTSYAAKGLERSESAYESWCFVADLGGGKRHW